MGREKTILLGFLGLLAGVFVGVLSLKLLVPRPPTGTGPDIRPEVAVTTAQQRVDPPAPSADGWDFAAAPPLVADGPAASAAVAAEPPRFSRFAGPEPAAVTPATAPPAAAPAVAAPPVAHARADEAVAPVSWQRSESAVETVADPVGPARMLPVAGAYVVQAGDSWWDLADRAYGDGRLYRALFAWNRSRDPRITLAPGTRLDVPPLNQLQATWPRLASPTLPR